MGKCSEAGTEIAVAGRGDKGRSSNHNATKEVKLNFKLLFGALCHGAAEVSSMRKHRVFTATTLVLGSGAAIAIGAQHPAVAQAMGILVSVIGAAQLVCDFGRVGRDHAFMRQRYYELLSELERGGDEASISASMTALYGMEPPVSSRLQRAAHNQAGRSLYGEDFNKV